MATDWEVVRTMERFGGHFIRILAELCHRADPENLAKIKATWPEYWAEYQQLAKLAKEAEMSDAVKAQDAREHDASPR